MSIVATHETAWSEWKSPHSIPDLLSFPELAASHETAVSDEQRSLTWNDLISESWSFAQTLKVLGLQPGDRVVSQLPNWWEACVVAHGTLLAGGVLVPIVPIYRRREVKFILDEVRPRVVVAPHLHRNFPHAASALELAQAMDTDFEVISVRGATTGAIEFTSAPSGGPTSYRATRTADDVAVILYTSGTTANPKGVIHTHRTLIWEAQSIAEHCQLTQNDVVFMASPVTHITGLAYGIVMPTVVRCGVVLLDRWDPSRAQGLIERYGCTFTVSATPFLRGLAEAYSDSDGSSLKVFVCGGADIPQELVVQASRVLQARVLRTYGSTELPTVCMTDPSENVHLGPATDGHPLPGCEVRIVSNRDGVGELHVRGPELFAGYVDGQLNSEAFTPDGWFQTGDAGEISEDGAIRISGRIKDIINRGGEKLSAAEIESLLRTHPAVSDVAVIGAPDSSMGERVCAVVVPLGEPPTLEELREHVLAQGAAIQKSPERLILKASLPQTASGKVQKFLLRKAFLENEGN